MAQSSDAIIKYEIVDKLGYNFKDLKLRIFTESSNDDQKLFSNGGLTFGWDNVSYGSCDACWYIEKEWVDGFDNSRIKFKPIIALEGTDALNRKSSGNAQYQRFHHALGAVKNGLVGVYYLKKGRDKIQEDLFGMAYYASKVEKGKYLITDDLDVVANLLRLFFVPKEFDNYVESYLHKMYQIFNDKFSKVYNGDWKKFADKRSTIVKDDYVIKYAGRMKRNFTDSSQRAGHIAVGEMYLTKYYFYDKKFYYLFPKMNHQDLIDLDKSKSVDKEWHLLRNEPNVEIKTVDDVIGLDSKIREKLNEIRNEPLKGEALKKYKYCVNIIAQGLKDESLSIKI